jgi:hypothetical protein
VDAVKLLAGDAPFIADTSAWWRFSSLPAVLAGLVKQAMDDDRRADHADRADGDAAIYEMPLVLSASGVCLCRDASSNADASASAEELR